MATAKVYNELDVSFFMDGTSLPLRFFRAWQDFTQNGAVTLSSFMMINHIREHLHLTTMKTMHVTCSYSKLEKFEGAAEENQTKVEIEEMII